MYKQSKQSRFNDKNDDINSMKETLNLNFKGMEEIKKKFEASSMHSPLKNNTLTKQNKSVNSRRDRLSKYSVNEDSLNNNNFNLKWQFKKIQSKSPMIRVETNVNRKNKYDNIMPKSSFHKTPLDEFLQGENSKLPELKLFDIKNQPLERSPIKNNSNLLNVSKNHSIRSKSANIQNPRISDQDLSEQESIKGLVVGTYFEEETKEIIPEATNNVSQTKDLKNFYMNQNQESYSNILENIDYQPEHLSSNKFLNIERDFQEYNSIKQNSLSLKACSLFDKNKLFENDLLEILCETKKIVTRASWEISLLLTLIPKQNNLVISTRLLTYDAVEAFPNFINDFPFEGPVGQSFSLKMMGVHKPIDFPKLQISLYDVRSHSQILKQNIPLPFTINKFISSIPINDQELINYVQNSQEIDSQEFTIDENYLIRASDFIEILPNLVVFDDLLYCMFINFGSDTHAAIKIEVIDTLDVKVTIYSHHHDSIFTNYLNWFLWMFKQ